MTDFIKIKITFQAGRTDGKAINGDDAHRVVDQIREDAIFGTFSSLDPAYWASRMERSSDTLSQANLLHFETVDGKVADCEFELHLADDLFPASQGGLQHLFGIIAGDLLQFVLPPVDIKKIGVTEVQLTEMFRQDHRDVFESKANNVVAIRRSFKLAEGMPLLAFSFKPRVGFALKDLQTIANEVLDEGFNVVELDTRYLARDQVVLDKLIDIAKQIAQKSRNHVARLSLNLSLPADVVLQNAAKLKASIADPIIIKIDGGFDGFSGLQAVRRALSFSPIVTCYPLLRTAFRQLIPAGDIVSGLVLSGADIIYPGGRPDVGGATRSLGTDGSGMAAAVSRYRSIVRSGRPMPSIAGGIYAGQLQAFYELLGPDVAWFLGGGVALHEKGPKAGARLCYEVAKESAALRKKAASDWAPNIRSSLITECDTYRKSSTLDEEQLRYVSPREILAKFSKLKPIGALNL